ncbi:DUF2267 domain-containing protein [Pseudonocardiaceae bacterium YIM PH 21723]|nr:DUF2267 domain-containing protein [Pseudonocardiaceae bacterium YIM PH 21723]
MQEQEIVAAVRELTGLDDADRAADATRATLSVLGQRLPGDGIQELADQLPPGIAEALPSTGGGEEFGVEEFYRRVAETEGGDVTADGAREHARAVVAVLKDEVGEATFDGLVSRLPADYQEDLLSTAPSGEQL